MHSITILTHSPKFDLCKQPGNSTHGIPLVGIPHPSYLCAQKWCLISTKIAMWNEFEKTPQQQRVKICAVVLQMLRTDRHGTARMHFCNF